MPRSPFARFEPGAYRLHSHATDQSGHDPAKILFDVCLHKSLKNNGFLEVLLLPKDENRPQSGHKTFLI